MGYKCCDQQICLDNPEKVGRFEQGDSFTTWDTHLPVMIMELRLFRGAGMWLLAM